MKLTILGDGKELFADSIRSEQPPRELDVAIDRVRLLQIEVDYGGDTDLGDHLNLGDVRITK